MAEVSVSTRISAPADEVWHLVGGWNALPDWHPAVEKSEVEQGGHLRHVRLAVAQRSRKFEEASFKIKSDGTTLGPMT
jgi:hypothetical protein